MNNPKLTDEESAPISTLDALFSQLDTQQLEAFFKSYRCWQLEKQQRSIQHQLAQLEQHIANNTAMMQTIQPSQLALAAVERLHSHGVDNVELLDAMIERGDTWLSDTMQLLDRCEKLDAIHGDYTQWCRYALDDAYNWLNSIDPDDLASKELAQNKPDEPMESLLIQVEVTEQILLEKLSSENETVLPLQHRSIKDIDPQVATTQNNQAVPVPTRLSFDTVQNSEKSYAHLSKIALLPTKFVNTLVRTSEVQVNTRIQAVKNIWHSLMSGKQKTERKRTPRYGLVAHFLAKAWRT